MKKIFLSLAVLATLTMASCQPSATKAEDEGAAIKAKIENCTDPDSLKIYVQQAKDYAAKLESEGDATAAKAYLGEVVPVIQAKDPSMANIFENLKETADSVVNATAESAETAIDNVKEGAKNTVENAKEQGKQAVENAKEQGKQAVDNAVNQGKEKAAEAAQKGADKVKDLLGK